MSTDYNKVSKLAKVNKPNFERQIGDATGLRADVRVKKEPSFVGKIERYLISQKDPTTIADNLAGRIVVEQKNIPKQV